MEYYSAMKKNQLLIQVTIFMNLKGNYTEWKKVNHNKLHTMILLYIFLKNIKLQK